MAAQYRKHKKKPWVVQHRVNVMSPGGQVISKVKTASFRTKELAQEYETKVQDAKREEAKCGTTHYAGCDCHEAARAARIQELETKLAELGNEYAIVCHFKEENEKLRAEVEKLTQDMHLVVSDAGKGLIRERDQLRAVVGAAKAILWIDECRCDAAYAGRGLHEPNACCGEMSDLREAFAALTNSKAPVK